MRCPVVTARTPAVTRDFQSIFTSMSCADFSIHALFPRVARSLKDFGLFLSRQRTQTGSEPPTSGGSGAKGAASLAGRCLPVFLCTPFFLPGFLPFFGLAALAVFLASA